MSGARPCEHCGRLIVFRSLRTGHPRPFDRKLLPPDQVGETARYVPTQVGGRVIMVPALDVAPRRLEAVRWFAVIHECAEGLRAWREKRDADDMISLQRQLAAVLGVDLVPADAVA